MTRIISQGRPLRTLVLLGLSIGLAGCGQSPEQHRKDSKMTQPDMTLWQTIDTLSRQIPFTREKVENVLATRLVEKDISGSPFPNKAFQFYTGGPITLVDGVAISNVDLRIRHRAGHPGFLVLSVDGNCITLDAVRAHYHELKITESPRGHSLSEATSYSTFPEWGKLSFGFVESNRRCLAYVAFDPKFELDKIAHW
jgi:hypothetical protein